MGLVVRVSMNRLGGGPPAIQLYAVGTANHEEAILLIREAVGITDEKLEVVGQLSGQVLKALDVEPNEVKLMSP